MLWSTGHPVTGLDCLLIYTAYLIDFIKLVVTLIWYGFFLGLKMLGSVSFLHLSSKTLLLYIINELFNYFRFYIFNYQMQEIIRYKI